MQTLLKICFHNPNGFRRSLAKMSKGFGCLAIAVLACSLVFPSTAQASCDHRTSGGGFAVMSAFQSAGDFVKSKGPSAAGSHSASIVGLWHVLFTSDGQPFDEGYDMWLSDGVEILNDTAPPQPANGAGTVCLGVYEKVGPRTYKLKHPFWGFDENSQLAGTGVISETVTVDPGGNSYHGSFKFDVFDLSHNLVFEAKGDLKAERITPD